MAEAKTIFKTETGRTEFLKAYDKAMGLWGVPYETFKIGTEYGECHVTASGPASGPPVVLFHGMTGNSTMWYETVSALQAFRTYCIDAPGDFGKSTVTRLIKSPQDAVRWMDQVMEGLGLESADFIGHSMGGWLCSNYILARPQKVNRLVLVAPVATFLRIPFLKLMRYVYPALLLPTPARIRRAWSIFAAERFTFPPVVMELVITSYTHCKPLLPVIPRVFPRKAWSGVRHPVLFLVGDEEQIYAASRAVRKVAEAIPQARTRIVPQAGHCLTIERPEDVNREIISFLTGS